MSFVINIAIICLISTLLIVCESFIEGESSKHVLSDPLAKFHSDDYSKWAPMIETGSRVVDLLNGEFFDEHLRDTPDHMRPPAIVAFYDSFDEQCSEKFQSLDFEDTVQFKLPSRAFLFAAKYDMGAAPKRTWYKFIPERDLQKRFGVHECPSIVFVPPECDGFTQWCERETKDGVTYLGCDDYTDQCKGKYKVWTVSHSSDYQTWVNEWIEQSRLPQVGGSKLSGPNIKLFSSMQAQEKWLKGRDHSTERENYRNNWIAAALPAFSESGFKAVQMSEQHLQDFVTFYKKWRHLRRPENWNSAGQTAVNGHEVEPGIVSLDHDYEFRDRVVRKYVKPVLEEWMGFPLQLTSHYGIREYYDGSWLKNHVDRIDVLIISATQSIGQIVCNTTEDGFCDNSDSIDFVSGWPEGIEWPLEGVDWKGNNVRYAHKPGTMVMYESAKFIHGRPYPLPRHPNHPKQKYCHLGAFSHFTPADGSWKRNGHDRNARDNLNRHTKGTNYKTNPPYYPPKHYQTVKQEHITFVAANTNDEADSQSCEATEENADQAQSIKKKSLSETWASIDDNDISPGQYRHVPAPQETQFWVSFVNDRTEKVELLWDDGTEQGRAQSIIDPLSSSRVGTHRGHKFFFRDLHSSEKLITYTMTPTVEHYILHPADEQLRLETEAVRKEREFKQKYRSETGKEWIAYYPREPTKLFIYPTETVGQRYEIATNHTYYHCYPQSAKQVDINACRDEDKPLQLSLVVESLSPKVFSIANALSDFECDHIISLAKPKLKRSTIGQGDSIEVHYTRTSTSTFVSRKESEIMDQIHRRIADVMNVSEAHLWNHIGCEDLQVLHYGVGQRFFDHPDYATDSPNMRYLTFLMYLNDVTEGGETEFRSSHLKAFPKKGDAVAFYSATEDGNADVNSIHAGRPVIKGEKWAAPLWIWDPHR